MWVAGLVFAFGLLIAAPGASIAAGAMQPKRNKDFRDLIMNGERPEIAACLAGAVGRARGVSKVEELLWDDAVSDRAIVREDEEGGRLLRRVHAWLRVRVRGSSIFSEEVETMEISCEQPEDGAIRVEIRFAGKQG